MLYHVRRGFRPPRKGGEEMLCRLSFLVGIGTLCCAAQLLAATRTVIETAYLDDTRDMQRVKALAFWSSPQIRPLSIKTRVMQLDREDFRQREVECGTRLQHRLDKARLWLQLSGKFCSRRWVERRDRDFDRWYVMVPAGLNYRLAPKLSLWNQAHYEARVTEDRHFMKNKTVLNYRISKPWLLKAHYLWKSKTRSEDIDDLERGTEVWGLTSQLSLRPDKQTRLTQSFCYEYLRDKKAPLLTSILRYQHKFSKRWEIKAEYKQVIRGHDLPSTAQRDRNEFLVATMMRF
jgi:hypothetical protein